MTRLTFCSQLTALALTASFGGWALPSKAEPILGKGYYEDSASEGCSRTNKCSVTFAPIEEVEALVLTDLRCTINATGANKNAVFLQTLTIEGNDHSTSLINSTIPANAPNTTSSRYQVSEQLLKVFEKDEKPIVIATFGGTNRISMRCNYDWANQ